MNNKIDTIQLNTEEVLETAEVLVTDLANTCRFVVNSQPTFEKAKEMLAFIKTIRKSVDEKKDTVVKPLNEALKNFRSLFKPIETKIDTVEAFLKGEVLKYNQKLLAEQKKREDEARAKIEAGASIEEASKKVENINNKIDQIRTRKVARLQITNESLIPREYLIPDTAKISTSLKAGIPVAGCEIVYDEIAVNSY